MWQYSQTSGLLTDNNGHSFQCYSGFGHGKNNPLFEDIPNFGPIPIGIYDLGELLLESDHGPYAIRLAPRTENVMYGRNGFLLHGDSIEHPGCASKGCIIHSPQADRQIIYESGQPIQVTT